jgi:prophage regulatory protein
MFHANTRADHQPASAPPGQISIQRIPAVKARSGQSRSTLYLRIAQRLWTSPVPLGPRMVGWPSSEVDALIAARISGKSDTEIRAIVAKLEAARKAA